MARRWDSRGEWGIFAAISMGFYAVCYVTGVVLLQHGMATNAARYFTAVAYLLPAFAMTVFMWQRAKSWSAAYFLLVLWGTGLYIYEVATQSEFVRDYSTVAMGLRWSQLVFPMSVIALAGAVYRALDVSRLVEVGFIGYALVWLSLSAFSQKPWILNPMTMVESIGAFAVTVTLIWMFYARGSQLLKSHNLADY